MAGLTDAQKLDFLWKKIVFGVTETTATDKAGPNESIASPLPIYAHTVLADSANIPSTPSGVSDSVLEFYSGATALECKEDPTVSGKKTWVAVTDTALAIDNTNRLGDWIPPTFHSGYQVKVYAGDPNSGGSLLNPLTSNEEWVFDYVAGVLHFPNNVPSTASSAGVWIEAYRYIGSKGVTGGSGGGGGATDFVSLSDTPADFTGQSGRHLVVNATENALVYSDGQAVQAFTFTITYDASGNIDTITDLPTGWTHDPVVNNNVIINHTMDRPPNFATFFGQSTIDSNQMRMRFPNTINELIYDVTNLQQFTLKGLAATKVGTGANGTASFNIFF